MTQSLKIECLVTDLALEGEIVSFLVTKEQLTAGLSKKADLVDGKIKDFNLPDFIATNFQNINQTISGVDQRIADGVQSAKDYAEAYTDEALTTKANLVGGKVPQSQLPSISEYSGLSEALSGVLNTARENMIERTDELQRTKVDLGDDGKVIREQMPNYNKIPGLEATLDAIRDAKVEKSDVYLKSETLDTEGIEIAIKEAGELVKSGSMSEAKQYTDSVSENITITTDQIKTDVSVIDNTTVKHVESIAELVALENPKDGQTVYVKSYYSGLGVGGGTFTFDTIKSTTNNGVTIFNGWVRHTDSFITATQGGCRVGNYENTDLLNNLFLVASTTGISEIVLDGCFKIGKLEKGITTTPFGDEPIYWLLKARSNITVRGRTWEDGLVLAGGLVASNASEAQTKGYAVFGDYNQFDLVNFKIHTFTIDNNGQNNLLPPVNSYGSQALCPNVWMQRGKNIQVENIHFLDNAGHQTIVLDVGVIGATIANNKFTDNGQGLLNNTQIWDHSTVYVRATDFKIYGNYFEVTGGRLPEIGTALEIHGVDGHVYGNTTEGYPSALIRAAFFGQASKNVKVHDNVFKNCSQVAEFDGAAGTQLVVEIYNNTAWLRSRKPYDNRPNTAFGHGMYSFNGVTPETGNYIDISITNNTVYQQPKESDWSTYNHSDNAVYRGGKYNKFVTKGNTYIGFSSGIHIDYRNNFAFYDIDDKFVDCGHIFEADRPNVNSFIWFQNIDSAWVNGQVKELKLKGEFVNCTYEALNYYVGIAPIESKYEIKTDKWIIPYLGTEPDAATFVDFNYSVKNVDETKPIKAKSSKVFGKIHIGGGNYFWKKYGTTKDWNMYREYDALSAPTLPRTFGDVQGDLISNSAPSSAQPIGYVCTATSTNTSTVGVWKGYGIVLS